MLVGIGYPTDRNRPTCARLSRFVRRDTHSQLFCLTPCLTFLANARTIPNQVMRFQEVINFFFLRDKDTGSAVQVYYGCVVQKWLFVRPSPLGRNRQISGQWWRYQYPYWRKAWISKVSKDTNFVWIENATCKVIREEHVTRTDDHSAHRIEILGRSRLYEFSHSNMPSIGGSATVRLHAYDYNASIN